MPCLTHKFQEAGVLSWIADDGQAHGGGSMRLPIRKEKKAQSLQPVFTRDALSVDTGNPQPLDGTRLTRTVCVASVFGEAHLAPGWECAGTRELSGRPDPSRRRGQVDGPAGHTARFPIPGAHGPPARWDSCSPLSVCGMFSPHPICRDRSPKEDPSPRAQEFYGDIIQHRTMAPFPRRSTIKSISKRAF